MEKETKVGVLLSVPINKQDIPEVGKDFTLVYCPDFSGFDKIFRAQRMTGKIVLSSLLTNTEIALVDVSEVRTIVFSEDGTGEKFPVVHKQWQAIVAGNMLDTQEKVKVLILKDGRATIIRANKPISKEELLMKVSRGFPNPKVAEQTIRSLGWKFEKVEDKYEVA